MTLPLRKKGLNQRGRIPVWMIDEITADVARAFPSFGGNKKGNGLNPLTHWMEGKPAQFAAGVDIKNVVSFVLRSARRK